MALFVGAVSDKLGDAVAHWPAALRRAGDSGATLDDVAYELLHMLRITNYDGVFENAIEGALELDEKVLFVGLPHDEVLDLERALRPGGATFEPMILLGDAFAEYAHSYGRTPLELGTAQLKSVVSEQHQANVLWTKWWNSAKPTLDLAYVLETVGIVAQQVLHLDDALLALESMANGEGLVAASLRSSVADQDMEAFADALGGVSLSAGVRYLLRQTLTDLFVDWVGMDEQQHDVPDAERADPAGIEALLPWMASSGRRRGIEDALGPVVEVTEARAGELYPAFQAVRTLLGYATLQEQFPLKVRGWVLPDASDDERGAFGRPAVGDRRVGGLGAARARREPRRHRVHPRVAGRRPRLRPRAQARDPRAQLDAELRHAGHPRRPAQGRRRGPGPRPDGAAPVIRVVRPITVLM